MSFIVLDCMLQGFLIFKLNICTLLWSFDSKTEDAILQPIPTNINVIIKLNLTLFSKWCAKERGNAIMALFAPATLVAQIAIWIKYIALAVSTFTIGFPNDCWWFKHKSFVCKANRSLSIKHNTICGHNFILHPLFIDHVKETFNAVHLMRK